MPIPQPGHLCHWHFSEDELQSSNILEPLQLQKFQTLNTETALALAEFVFEAGSDSATLLNTPQYWELRGRRQLILEILQAHDDATGTSKAPDSNDPTSETGTVI